MRHAIVILLILLSFLVHGHDAMAQIAPEDSDDPTKFHARMYETRPNRVRVILGDRQFDLPGNYLLDPTPPNIQDDDVMMIALWPGFEPRTKENMKEMYKTAGYGRVLNVLVTALGAYDNVNNPKDYNGSRKRVKDVNYMFEPPFDTQPKVSEDPELQYMGILYGLDRWEHKDHDISFGHNVDKHDILVPHGEERKTVFLRCAAQWGPPESESYSPGCQMDFITNGLDIQLHFHNRYLADWDKIRQAWIRLLDESFQHAKTHPSKPL